MTDVQTSAASDNAASMQSVSSAGNGDAVGSEFQTRTMGNGQTHLVPESQMRKMKESLIEQGRKMAMNVFEEKAQASGFKSFDDVLGYLSALRAKPAHDETTQADRPANNKQGNHNHQQRKSVNGNGRQNQRSDINGTKHADSWNNGTHANLKRLERLEKEKELALRKAKQGEKLLHQAKRKINEQIIEMQLREIAMQQGIKDLDYAVILLNRNIKNKTAEEISKFDEKEFFGALRDTHPYLFGEQVRPATTGTNGGSNVPPPLKAGHVAQQVAAGAQVDAMKMNPAEVKDLARSFGLRIPTGL